MAKPKKGVVPPQLKKYLFKKRRASRLSEIKTAIAHEKARIATARIHAKRRRNPKRPSRRGTARRVYGIITATRGGTRLTYDGRHFSKRHAARKFPTLALAESTARHLLKKYPVLRGYQIHVRLSH